MHIRIEFPSDEAQALFRKSSIESSEEFFDCGEWQGPATRLYNQNLPRGAEPRSLFTHGGGGKTILAEFAVRGRPDPECEVHILDP